MIKIGDFEKDNILITNVNDSFKMWLNKPYISKELKEDLSKANLLIIPEEKYRDYETPIFPNGTLDLHFYIQDNYKNEICSEICIEDKDYNEIALHDNNIWIATIIIEKILLPLIISVLTNFISSKYPQGSNHVELNIILKNGEDYKKVEFKGDADNLSKILDKIDTEHD